MPCRCTAILGAANRRATGLFAVGYVLAWAAFSILAATAQWALSEAMLLSAMMTGKSPTFIASLADDRGRLSVHPVEDGLPQAVPQSGRISGEAPPQRAARPAADGLAARHPMHRLLLGADGACCSLSAS
jgi:hypothetical protein